MKVFLTSVLVLMLFMFGGCSKDDTSDEPGTPAAQEAPVYDPVANAGGDRSGITTVNMANVQTQEILFLDGSASYGSSFEWQVTSKPESTALFEFTSSHTNSTGIYADTEGTYEVKLTVKNEKGKSAEDTVTITLIKDADHDGLSDQNDPDRDGDGFLNSNDLFPDNIVSHIDFDGDGNGNYLSADTDGDGVSDIQDDFPLDNTQTALTLYNESKEDDTTFNKNDGISIAENSSNAPTQINGKLYSASGSSLQTDTDFYAIYFDAGTFSIVVDEANASMKVIVSLVDATGQGVSSVTTDLDNLNKALTSVLIPSDGTYYLIITDAQGKSGRDWNYNVKIFNDADMDGLGDTLEQAIETNHNTLDSDGDTISDFIEVYYSYDKNLADVDDDGIPNWWDYDSDNDGLSDNTEFFTTQDKPNMSAEDLNLMNDIDNDGIPNFLDTDSDGNGVLDRDEAGPDYTNPIDTDNDNVPDYLDVDNDNDGILDINEAANEMNKAVALPGDGRPFAESLIIKSMHNIDLDVDKVCMENTSVAIELMNAPANTSSVLLTFKGLQSSINETAAINADGNITFSCPSNVQNGQVEFFITIDDTMRTLSEDLLFVSADTPVIKYATYNTSTSRIDIEGINLNYDLTLNLNGKSYSVNNRYGSSTELSYGSYDFETGMLSLANSGGTSNQLYVAIKRDVNVQIVSPDANFDMTTLDLGILDQDYTPNTYGQVTIPVSIDPSLISALIVDKTNSVDDPDYIPYLYAVALPNSYSVTVDAGSTAVAMMYLGLGIDRVIKEDELARVLGDIAQLDAVIDFKNTIESELASNPRAILSPSGNYNSKYQTALLATLQHIEASIADSTYSQKMPKRAVIHKGLYGEDATVTPSGLFDSIQVEERGDTGNINIYNDTQLYLSARVTDMKGKVLQDHVHNYFSSNLVGPQGYGLLFWATTTELKVPNGKNCNVEIVSPGYMMMYEPKILAPMSPNPSTRNVYKYLAFRTVIEKAAWPALSFVFEDYLNAHEFMNILFANAPTMVDEVVSQISKGDAKAAMKKVLDVLLQDLSGAGPITQAIALRVAKNGAGAIIGEMAKKLAQKIITKIAKKIGLRAIPVVGEGLLAYDVIANANTALNFAGTYLDFGTKDSVTNFTVIFPVTLDSVQPSKIIPKGEPKYFTLYGSGFNEITEHFYQWSGYKPEVTFIDDEGNRVTLKPTYIQPDGTMMQVTVPGSFLKTDIKGPLDIEIHHPVFKTGSILTENDMVEIVNKVTLSSVNPSTGSTGIEVSLYGSGFAEQTNNNEVTLNGQKVLVVSATEDKMKIMIPPSLTEGTYSIIARSKNNDQWSEWSNSVSYTVVLSSTAITVCDNGGAKDDAFQLYVNNLLIGSMYATNAHYCTTFNPTVHPGTNTAMLQGIEAPDGVGTYSISFGGLSVSGAALSGTDLTPGVVKNYTFEVTDPGSAQSSRRPLLTQPYIPFKPIEE